MLHKACALCGQPPVAAVNLGPLLGPIREVRDRGTEEHWVHRLCALWSSEVGVLSCGGVWYAVLASPISPCCALVVVVL